MCRKISLKLRAAIVFLLLFAVSTVVFIMFRSSMARTTYFSAGAWVQSFFKIADQKYFDFLEDYGNYTELAEVVDSDDAGALWQNLEMDDVVHDHHIHAIALLGEEGNPIASAGHFDPELIYDDKNDITEKIKYYNHFKYFKYHNDSLFVIYGVPAKDTDKKRLESGGYLLAIGNIQEMVSQMLPTNLWKVEYVRDKEYLKQPQPHYHQRVCPRHQQPRLRYAPILVQRQRDSHRQPVLDMVHSNFAAPAARPPLLRLRQRHQGNEKRDRA